MCILRGWWMLSCPYADSILWSAGFFCLQKLVTHFDHVLELLSARILSDIRIQLFQNTVVPLKLEVTFASIRRTEAILGASSRARFSAASARSGRAALSIAHASPH